MLAPFNDSEETVLEWGTTKERSAYCVYNDRKQAILFAALYEILDAAQNGKPYQHITTDDAVSAKK